MNPASITELLGWMACIITIIYTTLGLPAQIKKILIIKIPLAYPFSCSLYFLLPLYLGLPMEFINQTGLLLSLMD